MRKDTGGRMVKTVRNTFVGTGSQLLMQLANFIYRTIFVHYLSISYLGTQGLFSDIITMLSFAELGIGTSITFSLYKPIAEQDEEQIASIMNLFKNIYRIVGSLVLVVGFSLTPFITYLVNEVPEDIQNLHLIYILYVLNSGASYFFSYKRTLIIADQKGYIDSINRTCFSMIQYALQIGAVVLFRNFILALSIQVCTTFLSNYFIARKANRLYPCLKWKNPAKMSSEFIRDLRKRVQAMVMHKLGAVIIKGTDNILFSKFFGLATVGLYSNYLIVEKLVNILMTQYSSAMIAGVGNLTSTETKERCEKTYDVLFALNFCFYSFCTICMATLLNPFIEVWLGKKFLMTESVAIAVAINFYIMGMRQITLGFRDALGLFTKDRYKPIAESIVNIAASIFWLKRYGAVGVLLGTITCRFMLTVVVEPWVLYHEYFRHSAYRYYLKYAAMFAFTLGMIFGLRMLTPHMFRGTFGSFVILTITYAAICGIVILALFSRTPYWKEAGLIVKRIFKKLTKRGGKR